MNTFPAVNPSYASEAEVRDKTKIASFGDGYEQRSPDGLNHQRLRLNVVFQNRRSATVATIVAFLKAQGTAVAFLWTAPAPYNDAERQWVLREGFQHRLNGYDNETLAFVLEQDFNPPPA